MKILRLSSPEALHLAEVALFERIQHEFNIYPRSISDGVRLLANRDKQNLSFVLNKVRFLSEQEFDIFFTGIGSLHDGKTLTINSHRTSYTSNIRRHFNLNERKFWKDFSKKTEAEGIDPKKALVALRLSTLDVLYWAFDEVSVILG